MQASAPVVLDRTHKGPLSLPDAVAPNSVGFKLNAVMEPPKSNPVSISCLNPSTSSFATEKTTALFTFSVYFVKSSSLIYRESSLDFSTFLINSPLEFLSQLPSGDSPPISNYPLSILSLSSILTSSSLTVLPLKPFTIS